MENKTKIKGYGVEAAGAIGVAFELGFAIALPIVIFGFAGKWLDAKQGTHYFVYLAILLAIGSSVVWVYRRFAAMVETLKKASENKKQ